MTTGTTKPDRILPRRPRVAAARHTFRIALGVALGAALGHLPACDSVTPPDSGAPPITDTNAKELARRTATMLMETAAAALPVKDLPALFAATATPPGCPSMSLQPGPNGVIGLTLNYADGCRPAIFPSLTFAGSIRGDVFATYNAFDLAVSDLAILADRLSASLSGTFRSDREATTLSLYANVRGTDGVSARGAATVFLTDSSGTLRLTADELTVVTYDGTYALAFSSVISNPNDAGTFEPVAGVATVEQRSPSGETVPPSQVVRFGP